MISVIIPVFNAREYLRRCLDSVLGQSYKDLEVILVDDGSTDKSGILCDEYAGLDRRVKVFHQAKAGVSSARNKGISMVSGEYLTFADADDYIHPDMYLKLLELMEKTQADIVVCNYFSTKNKIPKLYDHGFGNSVIQGEDIINRYISAFYTGIAMGFNMVWNKLFRSSIIQGNHVTFDTSRKRGEDWQFILLVAYNARKIAFTVETFYYYTSNPDSITHTFERNRLAASEFNIGKALELNERWFHLDIDYHVFFRNTITHAVIVMSDAFILQRGDKWKIFDEFYHSDYFHGLIRYDLLAPFYAKALFRAFRAKQRTLAGFIIQMIAALRKARHWAEFQEKMNLNQRSSDI